MLKWGYLNRMEAFYENRHLRFVTYHGGHL